MELLKKLAPHGIAVILFIVLASIYFSPLFNGYNIKQNDVKQFQGASKEITDYRILNDSDPLWTNSMFGGMPAYQISVKHTNNLLFYVDGLLKLKFAFPIPVGLLFLSMLGFYIFALCLRINPWLGIIGSIAFGFSSFNILYIGAGHMTKVNAVAYMAPTLGGLILAFRGKKLLGAVLFALFFGLNLSANHLQITYYLAILCGAVALGESIRLITEKKLGDLGKTIGFVSIAAILGILPSASNLMTTYEYSKYTTRGATELTIEPDGKKKDATGQKGLDKNYILDYNYSPGEFLSVAIPNAKGGKDDYIGNNEKIMESLESDYADQVAQSSQYWGGQRFSGGAIYMGAIIMGLFLLGLVFVKDSLKWPFLVLGFLIIFLVGKENVINDFFLNQFPMYNKFRDSKMILVVLQVIAPAMALIFLDKLIKKEGLHGNEKSWLIGFGAIAGIFLVLILIPEITGSFIKDSEVKQFKDAVASTKDQTQITTINGIKADLIKTRISIFQLDVVRSLAFYGAVALVLFFLIKNKLNNTVTLSVIGLLVLADQLSVCKRYFNNEEGDMGYENYEEKRASMLPFLPEKSDSYILSKEKIAIPNFPSLSSKLFSKMKNDPMYKDLEDASSLNSIAEFGILGLNSDYRVLNFDNPFNETSTSYFHKSIGGYHGAKLKRYQEIIDFYISNEIDTLRKEFINNGINKNPQIIKSYNQAKDEQTRMQIINNFFNTTNFDSIPVSSTMTPVLNMMNTKYFITGKGVAGTTNKHNNGNAWFVSKTILASNANEEIKAMKGFESKNSMILNTKENKSIVSELNKNSKTETDKISLTKYATNSLTYYSESKSTLPAVFSEIWYPEGWNCYIDGKKSDKIFRANYILRGAIIPAGKHKIEWKFEPHSFISGSKYSLIGSIVLLLLVLGVSIKETSYLKNNSDNKN